MENTKKLLGAAAFSLALAGGGVAGALLGTPGSSGAQESPSITTSDDAPDEVRRAGHHRGKHLDAAADALGMTVDELRAELEAGETIADVASARGVDVDTVIDAIVADATAGIRERVAAMVNGEAPLHGPRGHHGPGRGFRVHLDAVATAIGISTDELMTALRDGQSIAQVAEAEGVDVQTVIDALVAEGIPAERAEDVVNHVRGERP